MNDDLISRAAAIDILDAYQVMVENGEENPYAWARLRMSELPSAQPEPSEITDEQAILHLQSTGWMQRHDKEMYESGLREQLADDSGSYDSLIPCEDTISRQAAIDAILAVTGNSSVRELYEHVQEHGLSDMWSGGVNAAIDIIIAVPSAQSEKSTTAEKSQLAEEKSTRKLIYLDDAIRIVESFYKVNADIRRIMAFELRQLPPAQPERKKGSKIVKGTGYYGYCACDQCGKPVHPEDLFCSKCGADFREEDT